MAQGGGKGMLALAAIQGICITDMTTSVMAPGVGVWLHRPILLTIGAMAGVAALYAASTPMTLTGRLLGGAATLRDSRIALAWTALPNVSALALAAAIVVFWGAMGSALRGGSETAGPDPNTSSLGFLLAPLAPWGWFVIIRAVGAAHWATTGTTAKIGPRATRQLSNV
jgi:hypothetical protein